MRPRLLLAFVVALAFTFAMPALAGMDAAFLDAYVHDSPWLAWQPVVVALVCGMGLLAWRGLPAEVRGSVRGAWFAAACAAGLAAGLLLPLVALAPVPSSGPWAYALAAARGAAALGHYLGASAALVLGLLVHRAWSARVEAGAWDARRVP